MIDLESFFKEKPVPDWFKTHALFKESDIKEVNKIFPTIGLNNFSIESNLETTNAATLVKNLCYGVKTYVNAAYYYFTRQVAYQNPNLNAKKRNEKYAPAAHLASQLMQQLSKTSPFVEQFATKHSLYLTKDIVDSDKKIFAKENEGLFKVYTKLADFFRKHYNYTLQPLDGIPAFKEFSAHNVNGKMNIVFSSDGLDGAWDILTMSMRGISSCQGWTGQYAKCTIGSVLDPFTGIIYLTSGSKTEHGSKMVRRCVVRFVVDSLVKRPCIFLEYMYPGEHSATLKAFKDAIRTKLGDRVPIIDQRSSTSNRYHVPYSETTTLLVKHGNKEYANMRGYHNQYGILPYRDTFMEYKIKEPSNSALSKFEPVKTTHLTKITDMLSENTNISDTYIGLIKNTIDSEVFSKIDAATCCGDVAQYTRRSCINYFSNKTTIIQNLLNGVQVAMKNNKDKSIFIPGITTSATKQEGFFIAKQLDPAKFGKTVKKAKTPPKKSKVSNIQKATAVIPAQVFEIPKTVDTMEEIVNKQIMPVISQVFKNSWEAIVKKNLIKKTTTKRPKKKPNR